MGSQATGMTMLNGRLRAAASMRVRPVAKWRKLNGINTDGAAGKMRELQVLDLFSGIGGFALGLEAAGAFRTAAFCEQDAFCQAVLRKHWPDVPIYDDVRTIDFEGDIDVITGGYPCQPFSVAGKQKGAADDRHLWPSMFEIIKHKRPRWVVAENVAGHITMGLDEVLFDLESEGYTARPVVIPACAVDAPHRRDRVWIVAHSQPTRTGGASGEAGHEGRASREDRGEGIRQGDRPTGAGRTIAASEDVADAANNGTGRRQQQPQGGEGSGHVAHADNPRLQGREQRRTSGEGKGSSRPTTQRSEDGGRQGWLPEPDVGRVATGVPNRVDRLKALGNAVVPQVVTQIGKAILAAEQQ